MRMHAYTSRHTQRERERERNTHTHTHTQEAYVVIGQRTKIREHVTVNAGTLAGG